MDRQTLRMSLALARNVRAVFRRPLHARDAEQRSGRRRTAPDEAVSDRQAVDPLVRVFLPKDWRYRTRSGAGHRRGSAANSGRRWRSTGHRERKCKTAAC